MRQSVYRVAIGLAAGLLAYTLTGFLLAPQLLERKLEGAASAHGLARVAIEDVSFNPFSFRVVLTGTRLTSDDGRLGATLPRIEARLAAGSVFRRDPVLRAATVERPEFRLPLERFEDEDSPFNVGIPFFGGSIRALAPARIDHLTLRGGRLLPGRRDPANSPTDEHGVGFSVEVRDLGLVERARFTTDASLANGARMTGAGVIVLSDQNARLEGDFELREIGVESAATGEMVFRGPLVRALGVEIDQETNSTSVSLLQIEQADLYIRRLGSGQIDLPRWLMELFSGSPSALATVTRIEMSRGEAVLLDQAVTPEVRVPIAVNTADIERALDGPTRRFLLEGRLPGSGIDRIEAAWQPTEPQALDRLSLDLTDIELKLLSPYQQTLTGRALDSGRLDLNLAFDPYESGKGGRAEMAIKNLELGTCKAELSSDRWPLDRAAALLEDGDGRIEFRVAATTGESAEDLLDGLVLAVRDRLNELSERPFDALAELAEVPAQDLDRLPFEPGRAELTNSAETRLEALARALLQRPGVSLGVASVYDPVSDRRALAEQQMRLHITLATSARPPGRTGPVAIDFDSARVRTVLDEFAGERLSPESLRSVAQRFPETGRAYYQALFNRLIENEAVSDSSLRRLAGFRTQTVIDALLEAGIDQARLRRSDGVVVLDGDPGVVLLPMEVVLAETQPCL